MSFPVLLYHSVSDDPAPGLARWTTSLRDFEHHVQLIRASGRTPLTISELAEALRVGTLPDAPVAITFDDGYADNLLAVEGLADAGLSATIYVTSGYVGGPRMLDGESLRALAAIPGVEIGAHSVTHPHLDEIPRPEMAREVRDSRDRVEDLIGGPVASFAYPHGAHDARVIAEVAATGFSSAAAVKNALSHPADDPLAIARLTIEATTTDASLERALTGEGFPVAQRAERWRTTAHRSYRRARRRLSPMLRS